MKLNMLGRGKIIGDYISNVSSVAFNVSSHVYNIYRMLLLVYVYVEATNMKMMFSLNYMVGTPTPQYLTTGIINANY